MEEVRSADLRHRIGECVSRAARGETYPGAVTETDVPVPMSDGTVLRADVRRPADAEGEAADGRFPVLVTVIAYNKTIISGPGAAAIGGDPEYFVKRGYVHVSVDARGTGSSGGDWQAFSARENADAGEIVVQRFVHLGVAVQTEAGLMVPVIKDADKKGVLQISQEMSELAKKARVALRTIHSVEKGMNCRMDTKRKILLALGLRFEDKDQVWPG